MLQFDLTDKHTNLKSVRDFVRMEADDLEWMQEYYELLFRRVVDGYEVSADDFSTDEGRKRYEDFDVDVEFLARELEENEDSVNRAARIVVGYIFGFGDVSASEAETAQGELAGVDDIDLFVSCSVYPEDNNLLFALGLERGQNQ